MALAAQGKSMPSPSPLDDAQTAAHAWGRFRRLMRFMFGLTTAVVLIAFALIYREFGLESVHLFIAVALGIGFTMLLTSALMGLMFLSSGTGHDDTIDQPGSNRKS
jgi:RsiW-degrading membrane proteinase PrsW (M82 family)